METIGTHSHRTDEMGNGDFQVPIHSPDKRTWDYFGQIA